MKVFIDNNLSPYLARALHTLLEPEGHQVMHLTDRFPPDTEDRAWIDALGAEGGWFVISADQRIHRNRLEREAWRRIHLVVFFLSPQWRRLRNLEIAWRLLRWWPRIKEQGRLVEPPAAFELPRGAAAGLARIAACRGADAEGVPRFLRRCHRMHLCPCAFFNFREF